jgi:hypothetical protein
MRKRLILGAAGATGQGDAATVGALIHGHSAALLQYSVRGLQERIGLRIIGCRGDSVCLHF